MKLRVKKLLSMLLSLAMLTGVLAVFGSAEANQTQYPTVYVGGVPTTIYADGTDPDSDMYFTMDISDAAAEEMVKQAGRPLLRGLALGQWDEFNDIIVNGISAELAYIQCDEMGEKGGTAGYECLITQPEEKENDFGLYDYTFVYDWRLDPMENGIDLHNYIQKVKAATGKDKVNLLVSGIGSSTVLSCFYIYGVKDINNCLFVNTSFSGIDALGALFTGNITLNSENVHRYYRENLNANLLPDTLIREVMNLSHSFDLLDPAIDIVTLIYSKIYQNILPRVLMLSYGTMPGVWSLIGEDYFDEAFALMFGEDGEEPEEEPEETTTREPEETTTKKAEETTAQTGKEGSENIAEETTEDISQEPQITVPDYRVLRERILRYRELIGKNAERILEAARNAGAKISVVVKYGKQTVPISPNADITGDSLITVTQAAPGTVALPNGEKFSDETIDEAKKNGSILFISPDYEIDATKAKFGVHTWFVKNLSHTVNPEILEPLYSKILNFDGYMSIVSDMDYPQYLVVNDNATRIDVLDESGVIEATEDEMIKEYLTFNGIFDTLKKIFKTTAILTTVLRTFIDSMKNIGTYIAVSE